MKRVFIQGPLTEVMEVGGDVARHIGLSLRMAVGNRLGVAAQDGRCGEAQISRITAETVTLQLLSFVDSHEPPINVWLAQALAKGDKMDQIIVKAVELGIKGVFPLQAEHCVVRYDETKQVDKLRRWQKLAREAAQQSGRGIIPSVGPFLTLETLFDRELTARKALVLYEGSDCQGLRSILSQSVCKDWIVVVGPEGGWSVAEAAFCKQKGAFLTGLGPRILRTETAGIVALSAIMYESGDLGGI